MKFVRSLLLLLLTGGLNADISGQSPEPGTCLCVVLDPLNIRDAACGSNVIGTGTTGQCFTYTGENQWCDLSGTSHHFFAFEFSEGTTGWAAGSYLGIGSDSQCDGGGGEINDYYTCEVQHEGMRIHETTSPTVYDCVDSGCSNTCLGGQCVAYVTCNCVRPGTSNHAPGTNCWAPGAKVSVNGVCNRDIPVNTAVATFSGGAYTYHTGVFLGCQDDYTVLLWDQWCCRQVGTTPYTSSSSYYEAYYVITSTCGDRGEWPCRVEAAGGTCCETYEPGCLAGKTWYPGQPS